MTVRYFPLTTDSCFNDSKILLFKFRMFSPLSIVRDLLWFQRSKIIQTQRVLCIGVLHFGPKRVPFWAKTRSILGQNALHFGPKHNPFCGKTQSILRQNAIHFAAKRNPFCGKTHPILRQNATHFAAKRNPFCGKTHSILRQNAFQNFRNSNDHTYPFSVLHSQLMFNV